jgi:toxin FitB
MKYLLDTCVLYECVKPAPNKKVLAWLEACDENTLFLSVLTLGEIQKGITKLKSGKRKTKLQHWLDIHLRTRFSERILPIDQDVARTWGRIQGEAEGHGMPLPTIDGLLAATALTHNLVFVTRNLKDVQATPAALLNPWKHA